jgi:hypothetical protein
MNYNLFKNELYHHIEEPDPDLEPHCEPNRTSKPDQ